MNSIKRENEDRLPSSVVRQISGGTKTGKSKVFMPLCRGGRYQVDDM